MTLPVIDVNFYWLLELFGVGGGASEGVYADKSLEQVTEDATKAHWFVTKEEAESFRDKAPTMERAEWLATEHGFT